MRCLYGIIFALFSITSAQAQVTIDVSKITCDQWVHGKVGEIRSWGFWFSGFYHGRNNKVLIDRQDFQTNFNNLEQFCYIEKNFNVPVIQALESLVAK